MGAGAEGEEQCPGLQGGTEQAVQARGSHRSCGAANAASPAENTFQAGEARDQVLGAQGGRSGSEVAVPGETTGRGWRGRRRFAPAPRIEPPEDAALTRMALAEGK